MDKYVHLICRITKNFSSFSLVEKYFNKNNYEQAMKLAEEIGAILWCATASVKRC